MAEMMRVARALRRAVAAHPMRTMVLAGVGVALAWWWEDLAAQELALRVFAGANPPREGEVHVEP